MSSRLTAAVSRAASAARGLGALLTDRTGIVHQAGLLWAFDLFSHVLDYAYHLYLGRSLPTGAFGQFQSYNSLVITALVVAYALQPVAARYTAAPPNTPSGPAGRGAVARGLIGQGWLAGLILMTVVLAISGPLSRFTGLSRALIVMLATLFPLGAPRGAAMGVLQGTTRLAAFGLTNITYAATRLIVVVVGVQLLGWGLNGVASTIIVGATVALALAAWLLRTDLREPGRLPRESIRGAWHIALSGLLMSLAFMVLTNADVVWVNRTHPGALADIYGRVVVLRRIVAVFTTAVSMALLPRVAASLRHGVRPDRAIGMALGIVLMVSLALVGLYAAGGGTLYRIAFGSAPGEGHGWILGSAVAMAGYSVVLVWFNVHIVADPRRYAALMSAVAVGQVALYAALGRTPAATIAILAATGWVLALAGGLLYWFGVRRALLDPRDAVPADATPAAVDESRFTG